MIIIDTVKVSDNDVAADLRQHCYGRHLILGGYGSELFAFPHQDHRRHSSHQSADRELIRGHLKLRKHTTHSIMCGFVVKKPSASIETCFRVNNVHRHTQTNQYNRI